MKFLGNPHVRRDIFDHRVLGDVHFLVTGEQHFYAGPDEKGRKDVKCPIIFLHNGSASSNH